MEDSNNNLENNYQDKKKMIMAIVIGAVTLLLAITGATYAYFQVSTSNNNTNSNVTVKTGKPGTATLKPGIGNLHIILNNVDMSESNSGKEYYADDEENYVDNETDGTHTISSVEITDGDSDVSYKCTADVEINLNTDADSMGEVLKAGDVLLNIEGQEIDLFNVKETNPTTVNLSFRISGNSTKEIQAYAKLINKNQSQNYLTDEDGKQLEIQLTSKNLDCDIAVPDPKIAFLRSKDTNGTLSKDIVGDMYRYQGADNVNNYICFGTTENCGTNEELIDKYMYRIIGITEEGEMKLIKETGINEGNFIKFVRGDDDWQKSRLFKRINGISNGNKATDKEYNEEGNTDIFIDSMQYEYLKSGDNENGGTSPSIWYNLIENHKWLYGEWDGNRHGEITDKDIIFGIENGKIKASHMVGDAGNAEKEEYIWNKNVNAKIGLMYMHDYYYTFTDNSETSWLRFTSDNSTWLLSSIGLMMVPDMYMFMHYAIENEISYAPGSYFHGVYPVFYLKSDVKIKDGEGTKTNPYILDVQE